MLRKNSLHLGKNLMGQIFRRAEKYLDQIDPSGEFIEIGTSRNGDDGSTRVIAGWAAKLGKNLQTVDIDPASCAFAQLFGIPNIEIYNRTGEIFLTEFPRDTACISFLYLDNFDWDWHPENPEQFVLEQQARYNQLGFTMNNINSQRVHLEQMMAAMPAMAEQSIVVLDDTWYNQWWGHYSGKGGAVVPYLLANGYTVLETEEQPVYGTIMARGIL
jgi:hypothetical protein